MDASPEAFFQKVQAVRPVFFRSVFRAYTQRIKSAAPPCFERELPVSVRTFPEVFAVDRSRLAKVGRLLKVARNTSKADKPLDRERGLPQGLWLSLKEWESPVSYVPARLLRTGSGCCSSLDSTM